MFWEFHGHGERAAAALSEAVPLLQAAGNDVLAAWAQADLADILIWRGDLEAGIPMLDEALGQLSPQDRASAEAAARRWLGTK